MRSVRTIRWRLRRLAMLLAILAAVGTAGCVGSFIYFPDANIRPVPEQLGISPQWLFLETQDRVRLSAWYVPQKDDRGLVLFFHGNGGNVSHSMHSLAILARLGYSTFIVDYRGYGRSEGTPSEAGTYRDAEASWQYVVGTLNVPPERIVVFGRSLGGAIAAWLARQHTPRALVLESTFTSVRDIAHTFYPWLPTRLLLGNMYSTEAFLQGVRCPVLVIHSPDDEIVPYAHGLRLFERAPEPKRFLKIRGRHNSGFYESLPMYEAGLAEFFATYLDATARPSWVAREPPRASPQRTPTARASAFALGLSGGT